MKNNQILKKTPSFLSPIIPLAEAQGKQNLNLFNLVSFGAKANELKTNQTKNIVLNKTNFNGRTDSVNYYNNKLNLKNSQFLNKQTNKDNLELNNLKPENLLLTLASKYLVLNKAQDKENNRQINNLTTKIKETSLGGETSIISSTLNYLDFTSNKYILNILKNKKALLKLEQAKIKKELERVKIKKEFNLQKIKKELILAIFLNKIEIDKLLIKFKSESLLAKIPTLDLDKLTPALASRSCLCEATSRGRAEARVKDDVVIDNKEENRREIFLKSLEVERSLIQLQLENLIIKLDKNNYKNKIDRGNLIKDLNLANLSPALALLSCLCEATSKGRAEARVNKKDLLKELELDKPFSNTFQGYYNELMLKQSFNETNSNNRILLKLKLIKDQLNIANNLDLNNLNSKIENFKFDFNKKFILNKQKGLDLQNNTLIHKYLNSFTKSNNIININPNLTKKYGIILKFNRSLGFNFLNKIKVNNTNWLYQYKEETYKLLFYFFKSIYCLISKPKFIFEQDKITIRLFFYLFKEVEDLNLSPALASLSCLCEATSKGKAEAGVNKDFINQKENTRDLVNFEDSIKSINLSKFKRNIKPLAFTRSKGAFSFGTYGSFSSLGEPRRIRLTKSNLLIKENLIEENKDLLNNYNYNLGSVFYDKFLIITNILSILFNKPVNLEITRLHNLTADSNILANAIQLLMKNKNLKPLRAISDIYAINNINGVNVPLLKFNTKLIAFLSGLNININGRLLKDAIVPKNTVKKFERGASAPGKVNFIDTSFITKKNRKGAYNIKVKSAQNFMF